MSLLQPQNFACTLILVTLVAFSNGHVDNYRLPKSVIPLRYNMTLEPTLEVEDIKFATFNGSIIIDIKALNATANITIHINNLNISANAISVTDSNGKLIKLQNSTENQEVDFYIINLEEELQKDQNYTLTIGEFSGTLDNDKKGFFLAEYKDAKGKKRHIAVTDMEPTDARRVFPCFDEPGYKAKFIINLIRPEKYTSLSNEELLTTIDLGDGRYQDVFKETVVMPTYLVAFTVSSYSFISNNERIRVFGRPELINSGWADYILPEAEKLLKAMEDFTGINYTLSKMDLFGVPNDYFESGAMENWGLVIYSEEHLFYSNTSSTSEDLQRSVTYTAHELAHQWFGNLVTPKWWKYMWLSEGFAAYFQYHLTDIVKPSWRLKDQYVVDHQYQAFVFDTKPNTEIMNFETTSHTDFPFMGIVYHKTCAIIRMAEHFLSHAVFKSGLRKYLLSNKFGATEASDVYNAFQEAIEEANEIGRLENLKVAEIFSTWDSTMGFPLVTVSRNYETGAITLSQETYSEDKVADFDTTWYIPITYAFQDRGIDFSNTTTDFWFRTQNVTYNDKFSIDGWLLLNKQQAGYYRVNYDETNWHRLIDFLHAKDFTKIHPINRAQLIHDSMTFARQAKLPMEIVLDLCTYLKQETDFLPLKSFVAVVSMLNNKLASSKEYDIFQSYVKEALSGAYNYLGPEEKPTDTHVDKLNRINIMEWLCRFGDSSCKNVGLDKLRLWRKYGFTSISPDLEEHLLCGAAQIAAYEDWHFLYKQYRNTEGENQRGRYLKALTCLNNETIIHNFMDIIFNPSNKISDEDRTIATTRIVEFSSVGLQVALEYLKSHPEEVERDCIEFDDGKICPFKEDVGNAIANRISSTELLEKIEKDKDLNYIVKGTKKNLKWSEKYGTQISKFLVNYSKNSFESSNAI